MTETSREHARPSAEPATPPAGDTPAAAQKPAPPRWRRWAVDIGIVLAVVLAVRLWQQRGLPEGPAPALGGTTVQGEQVSLEALRGRPVLLYFWASWCPVCKAMKGNVESLVDDGAVLTVATQSGTAVQVAGYLRSQGLKMPTLADPDGRLARAYGVRSLPTLFVLDPEGRIVFREVGYTTEIGLRLRMWWAGL